MKIPPRRPRDPARKGKTIPDQSMSIQTIVERYVRGLPSDVEHKTPVYVDGDVDLEKVARMDFAEKAAYAAELQQERDQIVAEAKERASLRAKQKAEVLEERDDKDSGSVVLDNTLPDDTSEENSERNTKKQSKPN